MTNEKQTEKQTKKTISVRDVVKCKTIISDLETLGLQGMLEKHHLFYEDGGLEFKKIVEGTKFSLQLRPDIERICKTKTISDCIKLLKKILPNWLCCQMQHPEVARYLLIPIHFWLTELRAECPSEIPPIPSDLLGIQDWITDTERALKRKEKKEEQSKPLSMKDWGKIFKLSPNKLREIRESKKPKYHFQQVSKRRWTLPKSELPAEYLEKFRPELKTAKEQ